MVQHGSVVDLLECLVSRLGSGFGSLWRARAERFLADHPRDRKCGSNGSQLGNGRKVSFDSCGGGYSGNAGDCSLPAALPAFETLALDARVLFAHGAAGLFRLFVCDGPGCPEDFGSHRSDRRSVDDRRMGGACGGLSVEQESFGGRRLVVNGDGTDGTNES